MGRLWVHFDYTDAARPRMAAIDDGLLIALKGANLNPGSEPEDMIFDSDFGR
jgi:zinc transporter